MSRGLFPHCSVYLPRSDPVSRVRQGHAVCASASLSIGASFGQTTLRARYTYLLESPPMRDIALEVSLRFTELRDSVYRYVAYTTRNPAEAEEITQEAFLRLYRTLEGGHQIESIPRWIFSIAQHLSIDRARRRERTLVKPVLAPAGWKLLEESVPDEAPSSESCCSRPRAPSSCGRRWPRSHPSSANVSSCGSKGCAIARLATPSA
jgi:hypothetical protein